MHAMWFGVEWGGVERSEVWYRVQHICICMQWGGVGYGVVYSVCMQCGVVRSTVGVVWCRVQRMCAVWCGGRVQHMLI